MNRVIGNILEHMLGMHGIELGRCDLEKRDHLLYDHYRRGKTQPNRIDIGQKRGVVSPNPWQSAI